jgi:hypothetical protein
MSNGSTGDQGMVPVDENYVGIRHEVAEVCRWRRVGVHGVE